MLAFNYDWVNCLAAIITKNIFILQFLLFRLYFKVSTFSFNPLVGLFNNCVCACVSRDAHTYESHFNYSDLTFV